MSRAGPAYCTDGTNPKKYMCQIRAHKKDLCFYLCYRVSYVSLHSYVTTPK